MKFAKLFAMCLMSFSLALYACDNNENIDDENGGDKPNKPGDQTELPEFGTIRATGATGTTVTCAFMPYDKTAKYFAGYAPYAMMESAVGEDYDAMLNFLLENIDEQLYNEGISWADNVFYGNQTLNIGNLQPQTEYIVMAALVELDGDHLPKIASKPGYRVFSTTEMTDEDVDTNWYINSSFSEEGTDTYEFTTGTAGDALYYGDYYGIGASDWEAYFLHNEFGNIEGKETLVKREILNAEFIAPITTVYPEPYGEYNMPSDWVDGNDLYVEGSVLEGGYNPTYGFAITYYYNMEADFEQLMYIYNRYATAERNAHVDIARVEGDTFEETREESLSNGEKVAVLYRNCTINISFEDYFGNKISGSYSGEFGCLNLSDDATTSSTTLSAKRLRLFSTVANFKRLETREAIICKLAGRSAARTIRSAKFE